MSQNLVIPRQGRMYAQYIYCCVLLTHTVKNDIIVIGRVVHDADTENTALSRLTETSVALEASRVHGGKRVALRFDSSVAIRGAPQGVNSVGLFPGSIVAFKGKNDGGGWFLVKEILSVSMYLLSEKSRLTNPS